MKLKTLLAIAFGIIVALSYVIVANSLRATEQIWLLTRGFGLAAFVSLSILVIIGELRILGFNKLFKLHCNIGILTFFLALLHGISAVSDKFKWGTALKFTDFLGFNFSSKWLLLMSIGTLAFYLIVLVALTSSTQIIQKLGFKKWKMLHYASYAAIAAVFVHSMLLGTDIKTSSISWIAMPALVFLFLMATGLLATRLMKPLTAKQVAAAIMFVVLLSAAVAYASGKYDVSEQQVNALKQRALQEVQDINGLQNQNLQLYSYALNLSQQIAELQKIPAKNLTPAAVTPPPQINTPAPVPVRGRSDDDDEGETDD
jgi:methionine sulfoxide reductase heme-binding subunit